MIRQDRSQRRALWRRAEFEYDQQAPRLGEPALRPAIRCFAKNRDGYVRPEPPIEDRQSVIMRTDSVDIYWAHSFRDNLPASATAPRASAPKKSHARF